ncbi:hypothetical protein C0J26_18495 [Pseudomonas baetica]|jgi:hypothetical protein|nr:hypothetical protein [Pseudomonas sp. FSL R10-2398]PTC18029.1 hypothetical protein C0J26_18495 [Pseudomonas baetica]
MKMQSTYIPILKAKEGELDALGCLFESTRNNLKPWFDVPQITDKDKEKFKGKNVSVVEAFLTNIAHAISKVWKHRDAYVDLPLWAPNAQTEGGEHVIQFFCKQAEHFGVRVTPVVDCMRWDDPIYVYAFKGLTHKADKEVILRLVMNVDSAEEMAEEDEFLARLEDIAATLNYDPRATAVMIDFGDVTSAKYEIPKITTQAERVIEIFRRAGHQKFVVSGCSIGAYISSVVPLPSTEKTVPRKEMLAWKSIVSLQGFKDVGFSDYGVRGPGSLVSGGAGNQNGKIRYTIQDGYFIARGYQLKTGEKGGQYYGLAQKIIDSGYYEGPEFSWGDKELLDCSHWAFRGLASKWIAIDTTHHVEYVLKEVEEFKRQRVIVEARSVAGV